MRILFTSQPGHGHFQPLVPTATALRARGHDVAFATSRLFSPVVEALGFQAFGVGPDWLENLEDPLMRAHTQRGSPPFVAVARMGMAADLIRVVGEWTPSIVVRGASEFGGMVAAEAHGTPLAVHGIAVESLWHAFIHEPVAALRASFGLASCPTERWLDGDLRLDRVPPSFAEAGAGRSSVTRQIRPAIADRIQEGQVLPRWVAELGSRPLIYATLGTVFNHTPGIVEAILGVLASEALDIVVTTGLDGQPERFGLQPPNVHVAPYLPQSLLFPHCDLVITHAGFNTVMTALSAGVPLYCLPLGADQPYNAARCVALGVGLSAAEGPSENPLGPCLQPDELDPTRLRADIRHLLAERGFRDAARRARAEILALPGPDEAARLVEGLAAREAREERGA